MNHFTTASARHVRLSAIAQPPGTSGLGGGAGGYPRRLSQLTEFAASASLSIESQMITSMEMDAEPACASRCRQRHLISEVTGRHIESGMADSRRSSRSERICEIIDIAPRRKGSPRSRSARRIRDIQA